METHRIHGLTRRFFFSPTGFGPRGLGLRPAVHSTVLYVPGESGALPCASVRFQELPGASVSILVFQALGVHCQRWKHTEGVRTWPLRSKRFYSPNPLKRGGKQRNDLTQLPLPPPHLTMSTEREIVEKLKEALVTRNTDVIAPYVAEDATIDILPSTFVVVPPGGTSSVLNPMI